MSLNVKFGGPLVQFKPDHAKGNSASFDNADGLTLVKLLQELRIPSEQRLLVILNGSVVPAEAYGQTHLGNDDVLSLMPPIQAG